MSSQKCFTGFMKTETKRDYFTKNTQDPLVVCIQYVCVTVFKQIIIIRLCSE